VLALVEVEQSQQSLEVLVVQYFVVQVPLLVEV
jgi:hypothetical protein